MLTGQVDAHQLRDTRDDVAHEEILIRLVVRNTKNEVPCPTAEQHIPSIGADAGEFRETISRAGCSAVDTDDLSEAVEQVADKHISRVVQIVRDQIGGVALKSHEPTVGAELRFHRLAITGTGPRLVYADERRDSAAQVAEKHVACVSIHVIRRQIGSEAVEGNQLPIRADRGCDDGDEAVRAAIAAVAIELRGRQRNRFGSQQSPDFQRFQAELTHPATRDSVSRTIEKAPRSRTANPTNETSRDGTRQTARHHIRLLADGWEDPFLGRHLRPERRAPTRPLPGKLLRRRGIIVV